MLSGGGLYAAKTAWSVTVKQGINLATESGELGFEDIPDQPVVHLGVAVDQDVSEVDDGAVLADPGRKLPVELGELRKRFTDDLEFALDGRATWPRRGSRQAACRR